METTNPGRDDDAESTEPDPYALAYMCGGTGGLLTLHLFELVQKGHLTVVKTKKLFWTEWRMVIADKRLPTTELSDISRELLSWFSEPQPALHTYQRVFPRDLKFQCLAYRDSLLGRKLLTGRLVPERRNQFFIWAFGTSAGLLLAAGLLTVWLIMDYIVFWFILTAILSGLIYWSVDIGLSAEGKRYVRRLKNKIDHLREKSITAKSGILDHDRRLAIAVFGVSALPQDSFYEFLDPLSLNGDREYGTENGGASEDGGG